MTAIDFSPIKVTQVEWGEKHGEISALRRANFSIPDLPDDTTNPDPEDLSGFHFLAFTGDIPVACARISRNGEIGFFAVLANYRSRGIGSALMRHLLLKAPGLGFSSLSCFSNQASYNFFQQFDFKLAEVSSARDKPGKFKLLRFLAPVRSGGGGGDMQHFQYIEECRQHCIELVSKARQSICIFSDSLDPALLDSREMASLILAFSKRSPKTSIRLLVRNTRPLKRKTHSLVTLSQRADNVLEIRTFEAPEGSYPYFYILTDDANILFRSNEDSYTGTIHIDNRSRVKAQLEEFDQLWNVAYTDQELRKLSI